MDLASYFVIPIMRVAYVNYIDHPQADAPFRVTSLSYM